MPNREPTREMGAVSRVGRTGRSYRRLALVAAILVASAGCAGDGAETRRVGRDVDAAAASSGGAVTVLSAWAHAGRESERRVIQQDIQRFNRLHDDVRVELTLIPEGSYNSQVQAAALAGDLPDLLEFDGPYVYNYVWEGHLVPIDDLLSDATQQRLIPSIIAQGTYRGRLYSVGMFDSGLGLYGRRSMLEAVGARIPDSPATAWSVTELENLLAALAARDADGRVIDLKLNYRGEWFTYGFAPILTSAGGGLVDPHAQAAGSGLVDPHAQAAGGESESADGVLNGAGSVRAMRHLQRWMTTMDFVDPNLDDGAFVGGRVALSWVGHWEYPRYSAAFGDDLVLLPLPDFGAGTRTGQGSWNWGIARGCAAPAAAAALLEFLLEDEQVLTMTAANGAIPATYGAIARSPLYAAGGPLHLYVVQLTEGYAVPRPRTPAYPVITYVFQQAFDDIRHGADVERVLDHAARAIDQDISDNQGYPPVALGGGGSRE